MTNRRKKNNWFYISLIFGLSLVALYFWESPSQILKLGKLPLENSEHTPYAVIENAQTQHFDENGKLSYEFFTKTLRHFRMKIEEIGDDDYTNLETPLLTLYTEDGPWYITADSGKATQNGNILTLWQHVRIWQNDEGNERPLELTTDKLVIEPLSKTVSTSSKVMITTPQGKLEAIGMDVNLVTKQIRLLKQVKGYHEPISPSK